MALLELVSNKSFYIAAHSRSHDSHVPSTVLTHSASRHKKGIRTDPDPLHSMGCQDFWLGRETRYAFFSTLRMMAL